MTEFFEHPDEIIFGSIAEMVQHRFLELFTPLRERLGRLPLSLAHDPFVIGYIVKSAVRLVITESFGLGGAELRCRISLLSLQTAFASFAMSPEQAAKAMHETLGDPLAVQGGDAGELVVRIDLQLPYSESDPRVVAGRAALIATPSKPRRRIIRRGEMTPLGAEIHDAIFLTPVFERYSSKTSNGDALS